MGASCSSCSDPCSREMSRPRDAEWPADLPAASAPEFEVRVVGWLLDRAPAAVRSSGLRHDPYALGLAVRHLVSGEIDGLRRAYSTARTELRASSVDLATSLQALEAVAAELLRTQREVEAVVRALQARSDS